MKGKKELKIFRKMSIGYLERLYTKNMSAIFGKDMLVRNMSGASKVLSKTGRSLTKLSNNMNIFKLPIIEGVHIGYSKTMTYVSEMLRNDSLAVISNENYLLREDLSESADYLNEKEWKIFRLPSVDKLEVLYKHSKTKKS